MSKEKPRYIDIEKKVLKTANNLCQYSLELMNNPHTTSQGQDLLNVYITIYCLLQESLLFGKAEAAAGMALLSKKILGAHAGADQSKMLIVVGSMLGDEGCNRLITTENYTGVKEEAAKWVNVIQKITEHYPDKNAMITAGMLADAKGKFNAVLPERLMKTPIDQKNTVDNSANIKNYKNNLLKNPRIGPAGITPGIKSRVKPKHKNICNIL